MNEAITIILILAAWLVITRFVFPRLGIKG
jgi:p-aminobenzoyl-glutamate transporter AbgT